MKRRLPTAVRPSRGLSLIEVLVAIVLISFGILGLVSLQARAVQFSVSAEDSQRAALLAGEMRHTMWGANTVTLPAAAVAAWQARVADPAVAGLPNATGSRGRHRQRRAHHRAVARAARRSGRGEPLRHRRGHPGTRTMSIARTSPRIFAASRATHTASRWSSCWWPWSSAWP